MFKVFFNRMIHTSKSNVFRAPRKRANPGAGYLLSAVESTEEVTPDFADMESDFMEVHKSHKQHELESQILRERTKLAIVKRKYFKEKYPNFLTYAEKEQIKLLHERDHEEWTIEKLSESFPASSDIVRKIIRADWKPRSKKRIREHDESVVKNWELLQKGSFSGLPSVYMEHLKKFSNRINKELLQKVLNNKDSFQLTSKLPKPKSQEFALIVAGCGKYQDKPVLKTDYLPISNRSDDTYLINKIQDKRSMRLHELKKLKLNANTLPYCSSITVSPEERAYENFSSPRDTGVNDNSQEITETSSDGKNNSDLNVVNSEIVISYDDRKRFEMSTAKDRIYIPKKLWRNGATYKVDDYYYDDDGEFLYRVPGMIGRQG